MNEKNKRVISQPEFRCTVYKLLLQTAIKLVSDRFGSNNWITNQLLFKLHINMYIFNRSWVIGVGGGPAIPKLTKQTHN